MRGPRGLKGLHRRHLDIARELHIFYDSELAILARVFNDYEHARDGYVLIEDIADGQIRGFIILGRIPLTVSGWDIYWLVVDKDYQGRGIGKSLIARAEAYILSHDRRASLRVETSTRLTYAHARNLYARCGFQELGRIKDFYDEGDDVVIYYKQIARPASGVPTAV